VNTIGKSVHMTSLECITSLVHHDICNSSVPHAWIRAIMALGLESLQQLVVCIV